MKKILLLIVLALSTQAIKAQAVVLDSNGVTVKWTGTSAPTPRWVQASPRGTLEWFIILDDSTKGNITNYAKKIPSAIIAFTPPGGSTPIPFNNIVTTLVTDMNQMFFYASNFNQPIGSWDVSNVTNMSYTFGGIPFNQPLGSWDVSNVTEMNSMFFNSPFNQPLSSWNVSNVTDMSYMFSSNSSFNQPLGSWNVSKVTDMTYMFGGGTFNQPIGSWNVSKVTSMSRMFDNNTTFNQPLGSWDVSNVTNMSYMFAGAGLSTANYDATLIGWATITSPETAIKSNVNFNAGYSIYCNSASARNLLINTYRWTISDSGIDFGCTTDTQTFGTVVLDSNGVTVKWTGTSAPTPRWVQASPRGTLEWFIILDDSTKGNITNYAKKIPSAIIAFTPPGGSTPIPFNNIVTTLVTDMNQMFFYASNFNQPIGSWDVSNVTNMSYTFGGIPFNQPLGSWDVSNVTEMNSMFFNSPFNQPLSSWNVSNVTDMSYMFSSNSSFNQPLGSWNVSKVTDMTYMFGGGTFNQPIGSWNVSKVTSMSRMFDNNTTFNQPLGSWDVSNVTNMSYMFAGAGLSTANYDATLIGWATITSPETAIKSNVNFNAGYSIYCNSASARNLLINTYRWTISDSGIDFNCASLGTDEFDTRSIKLYPNPTSSVLHFNVGNNLTNQPYKIVDTLGKVILKGNLNEGDNSINVEQLSKGIYFLKVSDKNASKIIKE